MLISLLISNLCINEPGTHKDACNKALEAAAIQSGTSTSISMVENGTQKLVGEEIMKYTGQTIWGVAGFGYKIYKDKEIKYTVKPKKHLPVDSITSTVNERGGSLNFGWDF